MKVLELREKRAFLINPDTQNPCPLKDISEDDILAVVKAMYQGNQVECDPVPTAEECPNEAERVIYTELKSQLDKLQTELPQLLRDIDSKFSDAEDFYSKSKPDSSFAEWDEIEE